MFSCTLCESADYDIYNGLYFCKTCGTLSQDHHVQEVQELDVTVSSHVLRKVAGSKKITIGRNLGRPWTIYEGFQCVILAQCDALISLGAKPFLKDIVYTIWANYLSKLEIAFNKQEKVVPDFVMNSGVGRRRELHSGTLDKPWNRKKKTKKSVNRTSDDNKGEGSTNLAQKTAGNEKRKRSVCQTIDAKVDGGSTNLTKENRLGSQDLFLDDTESESSDSAEDQTNNDLDSSDSSSDEESTAFVEKGTDTQIKCKKLSPQWMDLKKTVVFCYIGLRFSDPEILLEQLLRWVYDGKVPYMSTSHLLNDDMVLFKEDLFLFWPKPLTVQSVLKDMEKMTRFVSLPVATFPEQSVMLMVRDLLSRLHLPDELNAVCARIHIKYLVRTRLKYYGRGEFVAMQFIALALKFIYGLDDCSENQLSDYSEEVQKAIGSGGNVFVWRKWRSYEAYHDKNDFNMYRDFKKQRKFKYQHLDKIIESCHKFRREDRRVCVSTKYLNDVHHASKMEGLSNPIKSSLNSLKYKTEDCCGTTQDDESIVKKFKESTLSHILDPDSFKTRFKDNMDQSSWEALEHQRKDILGNLVYKEYVSGDERAFVKNRPNSYRWLLQFLSDYLGLPVVDLDKAVIALERRISERIHRS